MTKERKKSIVIIFVYRISIQCTPILTVKGETNSAWVCFHGWENLIWKFHCFYFGIFLRGLLWKGLRYSFHRWIIIFFFFLIEKKIFFLNTKHQVNITKCILWRYWYDYEIHLFPYAFWNFTSQDALIF